MKMKLDVNQQQAVAKELCLDASFAEVDMTNMTEVSGGGWTLGVPVIVSFFTEHSILTGIIRVEL